MIDNRILLPLLLFAAAVAAQERGNEALLGVVAVDRDGKTIVSAVLPRSPAQRAKLEEGDRLVEIEETAIKTPKDVDRALSDARPKDEVEVVFERDGKRASARARLIARKDYRGDFLERPRRNETGFEAPAWHAYAWGNLAEGETPPTLEGAKGKVVVFHAFQSW